MSNLRLALAVGALLVFVAGCRNPILDPADMLINVTVGPEYLRYVESDPAMTDLDKRYRRENVEQFRKLIEETQNAKF